MWRIGWEIRVGVYREGLKRVCEESGVRVELEADGRVVVVVLDDL